MGASRDLLVRFLGDAAGLKKATSDADASTGSFSNNLKGLAKVVGESYATEKVTAFAKASIDAATEDAASQKTLATTLRNVTGATDAQIAAAEDFIAKTQDATGVTDDLLRPALDRLTRATGDVGSAQSLLSLAMDVSAGTGKSLQAVSEALAKAQDGNTTALRKLGIQTKDAEGNTLSFDQTVTQLSDTFKGQAAAAADTQAGKLAIMKARYGELQESIGNALLPVMGELTGMLSSLVSWFNELSPATQTWIVRVAALGGGLLLLAKYTNSLTKTWGTLKDVGEKVSSVWAKMGANGQLAAVGAGLLVTGLLAYQKGLDQAKERQDEFIDGMAELARLADEEFYRAFNEKVAKAMLQAVLDGKELSTSFDDMATTSIEVTRRALEQAKAHGDSAIIIEGLTAAIAKYEAGNKQAAVTSAEFGDSTDDLSGATADLTDEQEAAARAADMHEKAQQRLKESSDRVKASVDAQIAAWDTLTGRLDAEQAFDNITDDLGALREANLLAWDAAIKGADDAAAKQEEYQDQLLTTKQGVAEFGRQLGLLPSEVETLIKMVDNGQIDDVERRLNIATRNRNMQISLEIKGAEVKFKTGVNGVYVGATGGVVTKPTLAIIGEAGPEAVVPLNRSPGSSPLGVGGGGGVTVNLFASAIMERDATRSIADTLIDMVRRGEIPAGAFN